MANWWLRLRHGEFHDDREGYEVSVKELERLSKNSFARHVDNSQDTLKRSEVCSKLCDDVTDDGSGD